MTVFQTVFADLDRFDQTLCPEVGTCLMFRSSWLGNGRRTREEQCYAHRVVSGVHAVNVPYHCHADLGRLLRLSGVSAVRLLFSFSLSALSSWEEVALRSPRVVSCAPFIEHVVSPLVYWSSAQRLVLSPHLFVYSIIYIHTSLGTIYFILQAMIHYYFIYFVAQNFPTVVMGSSFSWLLCASHTPRCCVCVLKTLPCFPT